jgi:hypothetical protein
MTANDSCAHIDTHASPVARRAPRSALWYALLVRRALLAVAMLGCSSPREIVDPTQVTIADAGAETDAEADADAEPKVDSGAGAAVVLATVSRPRGVAVGSGYVFVTSFGAMTDESGAILRIPIAGGTATRIASPAWPTYVTADSTHVYWTDMGRPSGAPGQIGRVPIAGGAEKILASSLQQPNSAWLFGGRIHFAESITMPAPGTGKVRSVAASGGAVDLVADLQPAFYVAANASRICWAVATSVLCKKDGAVGALTSSEASRVFYVALDESYAYYVLGGGVLRRVAFDGSAPVTLDTAAKDILFSGDIALDATHVYWISGTDVRKVAKSGGPGVLLHREAGDAVGIAVDTTHVYFTSWPDNAVKKIAK